MSQVELFVVEDTFQIQGQGLVVTPDFSVPDRAWKDGARQVRIVKPDGEQFDADARFYTWHFNIRDPEVPVDRRLRVVVSFPALTKDQLPVGSRILGDAETGALLKGAR
jgi:hypothetical protein